MSPSPDLLRQKINYVPSPSAEKDIELRRLAVEALERQWGALISCGSPTRLDVNVMSNLALGYYAPVAFSSSRPDLLAGPIQELVEEHRRRGYWGRAQTPDEIVEELPVDPYPATIAMLHLKGEDLEDLATCFATFEPLLKAGAAVVYEDPGASQEGNTALDGLRALASGMGLETRPTAHPGLLSWIAPHEIETQPDVDSGARPEETFTVLSYPQRMAGKFSYLCAEAGYRIETDPRRPFDMAIKWHPQTFTLADAALTELSRLTEVINLGCDDISKQRVEEEHKKIFGYGLIVDARTHHGLCVQKPNLNGQSDEHVVECPQPHADQKRWVYQRLVTTPTEPEEYEEYRVAITGDEIPLVIIKRRPVAERFNVSAGYGILTQADEVFSREEQAKILALCRVFRLDFGDLDILREQSDGRIYVLDVNPTPGGPGGGYTEEQRQLLVKTQLSALRRQLIQGRDGVPTD